MNLQEGWYHWERTAGGVAQATADRYAEAFDVVVSIDEVVARVAFGIMLKSAARLPPVDALIAACAMSANAILVHRDKHMSAIPAEFLAQLELCAGGMP